MLLDVGFGDAFDTGSLLDDGKVSSLLAFVMIMQHLAPTLAEGEEVVSGPLRDGFALQIHGVHAPDDDIVGQGHFRGGLDELVDVLRVWLVSEEEV